MKSLLIKTLNSQDKYEELKFMEKQYNDDVDISTTGLKPSALADNPLDLHNSSYHIQPRAIIAQ